MCGAPDIRATQWSLTLTLSRQRERELEGRKLEQMQAEHEQFSLIFISFPLRDRGRAFDLLVRAVLVQWIFSASRRRPSRAGPSQGPCRMHLRRRVRSVARARLARTRS